MHKLVRAQERSARQMYTAWRRPSLALFHRQFGPKRGYGGQVLGGHGTAFHFYLNQCCTGRAGARHQAHIERKKVACASFGNIAGEFSERKRLWDEIE